MICLALVYVTAGMIYDGDTISKTDTNAAIRLESEHFEFDTPEVHFRAACEQEARLGLEARDLVRARMPGVACIVGRGTGAWSRDVGVLYDNQLEEIAPLLMERGLAKEGRTAEWCD